MKKLAGALVLALVVAAPVSLSTSAAQASPVKSQPHMAQSVNGKHQNLNQQQGVKTLKKKRKVRRRRKM